MTTNSQMEVLAVEWLESLMMPCCVECNSTRDLTHCASCTEGGDGMQVLCPTHVVKHLAEVEECRTDNEFKPIAEDFRFTHHQRIDE